jgi:hypothetical protein
MAVKNELDRARSFASAARELALSKDLSTTAKSAVVLAAALTGCDSATLWTLTEDRITLTAATNPAAAVPLAEAINALREGPEWDCLHGTSTIWIDELRVETRWPRYRDRLLQAAQPTLSLIAFRLDAESEPASALILSSTQAGFFNEQSLSLGAIFADHASVALAAATVADRAARMELTLSSNRRIGIAIGMMLARYRCTEEQAFALLESSSQASGRTTLELAEQVIGTGLPLARVIGRSA